MIDTRSREVLIACGNVIQVTAARLEAVRDGANCSPRKRARLCTHPAASDPIHEMLICLARGTYVRPHRHKSKSESFHIIEGELDVVLFNDSGAVREVIRMGPYHSHKVFYYRLMEPCFHTVLIHTPEVLFHETTNGPFDPAETECAEWAPQEGDTNATEFMSRIRSSYQ